MRRHAAGFTLLEVLIVIGLLGALMALGIPNYTAYRSSAQAREVAQQVANIVNVTRSESKRGRAQRIVLTSTGMTVTPYTQAGSTWTAGAAKTYTWSHPATVTSNKNTVYFAAPYGTMHLPPATGAAPNGLFLEDAVGTADQPLYTVTRGNSVRKVRLFSAFGKPIVQ